MGDLRPRRLFATAEQRKAILDATLAPPGEPPFGVELTHTYGASYLEPGQGQRSLTTVVMPADQVRFTALWRDGSGEPDYRVHLPLRGATAAAILPVKDHFLLRRAERHSPDLDERIRFLTAAVRGMGALVAVRLGLSRPYQPSARLTPRCWLMADGFFSRDEPQP